MGIGYFPAGGGGGGGAGSDTTALHAANNLSDVANALTSRVNLGAAQRLTPTAVKTANYTAALGELVECDATAAGFTVTLPTTPAAGSRVVVKKLDATANAVTVAAGGTDVILTGAGTTAATMSLTAAETREFLFDTTQWVISAGQIPTSTLDARYAQRANNLSDVTAAATARTNLGVPPSTRQVASGTGLTGGGDLSADRTLAVSYGTTAGTAAQGNDSRITGAAQTANNLSDLASAGTSRTNLGLGGAATLSVGTTAGTVAAGDDSRITAAIITADVQVFTSSGTWTRPTGAKTVDVLCIGPGGGGGAGGRYASGQITVGGGGGGGGGMSSATFVASTLTSPVTVTVPAGGSGGAAQTTDSTAGANGGTPSGSTTFGTYLQASRGGPGVGGGQGTGGGAGAGGQSMFNGVGGAAAPTSGAAGANASNGAAAPGGGAGGGIIVSGPTASAGGTGATSNAVGGTSAAGGTVGAGQNGTAGTASGTNFVGMSGGGGASNTSAAAGTGGAGGIYGGGGGGGGASLNGSNSGAGGAGGGGVCVVITYF